MVYAYICFAVSVCASRKSVCAREFMYVFFLLASASVCYCVYVNEHMFDFVGACDP